VQGSVRASNELPTIGWWFWKDVNRSRTKIWALHNRHDLWGMRDSDGPVPG
jgi:hypothetical protein